MPEFLEVTRDARVLAAALNRPPVNAVNAEMLKEIRDVFTGVADDRSVSVIVLTSALDRIFCGGADIMSGTSARPGGLRPIDPGATVRSAFWSLLDSPVPVIAAVNGPALGAGMAFAACCDIILASERAVFGCPEIDVGVLGGAAHLERLVGRYRARELYLTGRRLPAREFAELSHAISQVLPHDDLRPAAAALAAEIAAKSPASLRLAKEAFNRIDGLPLKDAYRIEQDYTNRLRQFDDSAEAARAFREKRPPRFTGD